MTTNTKTLFDGFVFLSLYWIVCLLYLVIAHGVTSFFHLLAIFPLIFIWSLFLWRGKCLYAPWGILRTQARTLPLILANFILPVIVYFWVALSLFGYTGNFGLVDFFDHYPHIAVFLLLVIGAQHAFLKARRKR